MSNLTHDHGGPCKHCGAITIYSVWWTETECYVIHTCPECDAPSPDEPFAD